MPKVDLVATKLFKYMTRRLVADEPFQAKNEIEARILKHVRKVAEDPKPKKAAPVLKVEEVLEAEVVETPQPAEPVKAAPTRAAPKAGARSRKAKAKK
jgi:hypothetical protein